VNPPLAREAFGWDPTTTLPWSHNKVRWQCHLGHVYEARIADRSSGDGCPFCIGKKVLVGFNDLKSKNPLLASQAFGWNPETVTEFSNKKLRWKCENGHQWNAAVSHRSSDRGCPTCSKSGYDPNSKGFLYFLEKSEYGLLQIGITNVPQDRLSVHRRNGWQLIELRGPMDGYLVQQWETAILRHIRSNGGKMADRIGLEPFDGYSESWLKESFSFGSLKEIMDAIDQEDRKP
jgi:translation initiation factor IF-1